VAEAYTQLISDRHPDPDHRLGSARSARHDEEIVRAGLHPQAGAVLRSMMVEGAKDPRFATEFQTFIADRRRVLSKVLQRGIDRGELGADTKLDVAVDALFGPFWYRLLSPHAPSATRSLRTLSIASLRHWRVLHPIDHPRTRHASARRACGRV